MKQGVAFALATLGVRKITTVAGPPAFDPEAGLTLTRSLPHNTNLNGLHTKAPPVVYAVDFTGLVGNPNGVIWESGGAILGASLCVQSGNLVLRAGKGSDAVPAGSGYSYIVVPCPTGAGTLVWEINPSTVRMWWNGLSLGAPTGSYTGDYAGGDESRTFAIGSDITTGSPKVGFTGYSTRSLVRYYENQTVGG